MKSGMRITSNLPKWLLLTLVLTLAPAALASNIWYVDGVNGNDNNDCLSSQSACQTIGHAISLCSSGDSIMVAPAIYTENLTIGISLKILGSDGKTTIIDGGGNGNGTVIYIGNADSRVTLSKLTIRNGDGRTKPGGIFNMGTLTIGNSTISGNSGYDFGGIWNGGRLTINNSTISGNYGFQAGGIGNENTLTINKSTIKGNSSYESGGIGQGHNGTLTINKSTLSENSAGEGQGGGVSIFSGKLTINNSTISGNSSWGGGGVYNERGTLLTINNSTISGNSPNGVCWNSAFGGKAPTLRNSIVAKNSPDNCGGTITTNGYNLSSDDTCNFTGPGDMNNTDPVLGKFGNHGGPTQTIPLLPGSPAIDAGNPSGCTDSKGNLLKTDQRGWSRPGKYDTGACDIGAFERQHD